MWRHTFFFLYIAVNCGNPKAEPLLKDKQAGKPPGTSESADVPDAQVWYL